jgi:hypothetical protein
MFRCLTDPVGDGCCQKMNRDFANRVGQRVRSDDGFMVAVSFVTEYG